MRAPTYVRPAALESRFLRSRAFFLFARSRVVTWTLDFQQTWRGEGKFTKILITSRVFIVFFIFFSFSCATFFSSHLGPITRNLSLVCFYPLSRFVNPFLRDKTNRQKTILRERTVKSVRADWRVCTVEAYFFPPGFSFFFSPFLSVDAPLSADSFSSLIEFSSPIRALRVGPCNKNIANRIKRVNHKP